MVSVENAKLRGGGARFKQQLWDLAKETLQVRSAHFTAISFLPDADTLTTTGMDRSGTNSVLALWNSYLHGGISSCDSR